MDNRLNVIIELAGQSSDIAVLWLYGSRAKGNAHSASDYYLSVAFRHFIKSESYARLSKDLKENAEKLNMTITLLRLAQSRDKKSFAPLLFTVWNYAKVCMTSHTIKVALCESMRD